MIKIDSNLQRIAAAQETLSIFERGDYGKSHEHSLKSTTLYTPDSLESLSLEPKEVKYKPVYRLVDLSVVSALKMLKVEGNKNIHDIF